ncbi:MAG: rhodanese-like domain-containing protein [Ilumatobacteraceae bacterium]
MNIEPGHGERHSIDEVLVAARARLERIEAAQLAQAFADGAMIVDIRPHEQRTRDGELPGAVVIDRNTLEWRLDPSSAHHIADITGWQMWIVIVCNEGYSSSLAAAMLQDLGLHRATDLVGGFQAWLTLDVQRSRTALASQAPVPRTTPRPGT